MSAPLLSQGAVNDIASGYAKWIASAARLAGPDRVWSVAECNSIDEQIEHDLRESLQNLRLPEDGEGE